MFNPIDMMQGPGAAGMQSVAQQFGLSPEQTRRALEALLPAFAIGLQRTAPNDPTGFANLFGSPVLTQAVLQQASLTSGVGAQVLRQMLPMMAGAVVASIVHMLLNPPAAAAEPAPASGFPAMNQAWLEMMKAFMPGTEAARPPSATPSARPAQPGRAAQAARPAPRSARPDPRSAGARPAEQKDVGRDLLQQMLQTGAEVQEQNVRAMQSLFDTFWSEARRDPGAAAPQAATPPGTPRKP